MDLVTLADAFGGFVWVIIAFVVALSVIVAIHEYGHYIVGRWCGIHSETFSLGFGPVIWSRHDKRGTKWQLAALPFGGYVKFLGDKNAASVGVDEDVPLARNTMHGAPLWARAATVAAGPIFNFILSILVFAAVLAFRGEAKDPLTVADLRPLPGPAIELQLGDELRAIAGQDIPELEQFEDFEDTLPVAERLDYLVSRKGAEITVSGPFPYPPMVLGLNPQSAAIEAGLEVGDVITVVNGTPVFAFRELQAAVKTAGGTPLALTVWRDGETFDVTLTPKRRDLPLPEGGFETRWLLGISGGLFFEPATTSPGVGASLVYGVQQTGFIISSSLSGLWNIITGAISSCNISGPVGIAKTSGAMASQGISSFVWFIAVLSTAVGLLNLFPIPVLDGGHLVFHAYEAVRGKPPTARAMNVMMSIGLALIGTLMVFALGNDLFFCR